MIIPNNAPINRGGRNSLSHRSNRYHYIEVADSLDAELDMDCNRGRNYCSSNLSKPR